MHIYIKKGNSLKLELSESVCQVRGMYTSPENTKKEKDNVRNQNKG